MLVSSPRETMIRVCEGFPMQARICITTSVLWALILPVLILPAIAQAGGGGGGRTVPVNPPPTLPRPDPSNFDKDQLLLESETRKSKTNGGENTCFLPPLNSWRSHTVGVADLQLSPKAKKEYEAACGSFKDKKYEAAETHLRKAVQQEPKYATAWVTLGQILAARQHNDEARDACSKAVAADANYVPSYLCLADLAARNQQWDDMLKFSGRALDLDPTENVLAYDYNAGASLSLHKLPEAERSALRALDIDKNHSDPRVHFLLAQIYEAKGDAANEAVQLREYLKFASDPKDAAMVKQYLAELEKKGGK
jgi:tetratricopeptide (TPR) repeat protein